MTQEQIDQLIREFHAALAQANTAWQVSRTHYNEFRIAGPDDKEAKRQEYGRLVFAYKQAQATADEILKQIRVAQIEADQ